MTNTLLKWVTMAAYIAAASGAAGEEGRFYSLIPAKGNYPEEAEVSEFVREVPAWAGIWSHDFRTAKLKAIEKNRDLFIYFTGEGMNSVPLGHPVQNFFQNPQFVALGTNQISLLELTHKVHLSDREIAKMSPSLRSKYVITPEQEREYTTYRKRFAVHTGIGDGDEELYVLCDYENRPIMRNGLAPHWTSYDSTGKEAVKFVGTLKEAQAARKRRDELLKEAADLEGMAKARKITQALQVLDLEDPTYLEFYAAELNKILAADPERETPLIRRILTYRASVKRMEALGPKFSAAMEKGDLGGLIEILSASIRDDGNHDLINQTLYYFKATAETRIGEPAQALQSLKKCERLDLQSSLVKSRQFTKLKSEVEDALDEE